VPANREIERPATHRDVGLPWRGDPLDEVGEERQRAATLVEAHRIRVRSDDVDHHVVYLQIPQPCFHGIQQR
jgi:hypothetical protein